MSLGLLSHGERCSKGDSTGDNMSFLLWPCHLRAFLDLGQLPGCSLMVDSQAPSPGSLLQSICHRQPHIKSHTPRTASLTNALCAKRPSTDEDSGCCIWEIGIVAGLVFSIFNSTSICIQDSIRCSMITTGSIICNVCFSQHPPAESCTAHKAARRSRRRPQPSV